MMKELTPREIVVELDRHIVGQNAAKKAVAVAVRNRWRRQRVDDSLKKEIAPKNIMMIGPTGVGKTEIARRLATLTGAPFLKVEATKYTEVGYYGRDVESMIRELVENSIGIVRETEREKVRSQAETKVEERLVDLLVPSSGPESDKGFEMAMRALHAKLLGGPKVPDKEEDDSDAVDDSDVQRDREIYREKIRAMLANGELENRTVTITSETRAIPVMMGTLPGMELDLNLEEMFEKIIPKQQSKRELTVKEAREFMFEQECDRLINKDKLHQSAIELAENLGIVFIDEIDKIVASDKQHGADVSRQGVQRDLLPIVEGTTVQTKFGYVKTDHILFIAAGAFHKSKPSELMPELQGRFPIRVELTDLSKEDFIRILQEPRGALTKQYIALMATENITIQFEDEAIDALAGYAFDVNQKSQNIGARRLYTIMERLLEELSFEAPDMKTGFVSINAAYVRQRLDEIAQDEDLNRFIL